MAGAIITRDGPRGHLHAIPLAGIAFLLLGGASSWAQEPYSGPALPFCEPYPPGAAPAIGPSNCTPIPAALWGNAAAGPDIVAQGEQTAPAAPRSPLVGVQARQPAPKVAGPRPTPDGPPAAKPGGPQAPGSASPPAAALAAKPPAPQAAISLETPGAITLDQIAAMLGPAAKRTVVFALSAADEYKKADLTHRVRLTWTGSLQALVDQLAEIYGLDVAIDDTAIRFSSRPGELAGGASTTRTP